MKKIEKIKVVNNLNASSLSRINEVQDKAINLGLDVEYKPGKNPPEPSNYVYCAGEYCCCCETHWDPNNNRYVRVCYCWHKTTSHSGQWL